MHDRIAEWADSIEEFSDPEFGEHTLEVVFDELGVPETIRFDLANADDEESTLREGIGEGDPSLPRQDGRL